MAPPAMKSARRQRVAEGLAHMRAVQAAVVALLAAAGDDLEAGEQRPLLGQDRADLLLEDFQIGKLMDPLVARRARHAGKADDAAHRDRMTAVRLIGAV